LLSSMHSDLRRLLKHVYIRATLYAVCGLLAFSLALICIDYLSQVNKIGDRLARTAHEKALFVTNIAAREIENKNYGEVERLLNAIAGDRYIVAAKAYSRFGHEFASDFTSAEPSSVVHFSELALDAAQNKKDQYLETEDTIEYVLPVFRGDEAVGSVLVRVSKQEMAGILRDKVILVATVLGLLLLAFVPVLGLLMYRATSGVSRVTQAANEAAEGFLDCNLRTDAPGEVGELQTAFREMMVNLRRNTVKIEKLAYTDRITGLPNRAKLDNTALSLIDLRPLDRGGVFYVGLDRFKLINDLHGHAVGDRLLALLAERLAVLVDELAQPYTTKPPCVARFSGDEFVVLVPGLSDAELLNFLAKSIVSRMGATLRVGDLSLSVSVSVGVVTYPEHGTTAEAVIRNANMAMCQAKTSGRSKSIAYNDKIRKQMTEREQISDRLKGALRDRALAVHYQPKVNISTGEIVGSEALLRWQDEELGSVPPDRFVPVAEENGLIIPIGEFVLETALGDMKSLQKNGVDVCVAVNVAPTQLQAPGFTDRTLGIIGESGFSTERLELEITESSLVDYSQSLLDKILPIKDEGVKFAIDDFGTGYSSLHSLASMPFDTLKVDRSFIMDIANCEHRRTIVELILLMARQLDLNTVSEGIETKLQKDYINLWGGTLGQGFLWSPAVPIEDFSRMVGKNRQIGLGDEVAAAP
jgi:diguanylate cyclase (GGDEF)-like protein